MADMAVMVKKRDGWIWMDWMGRCVIGRFDVLDILDIFRYIRDNI